MWEEIPMWTPPPIEMGKHRGRGRVSILSEKNFSHDVATNLATFTSKLFSELIFNRFKSYERNKKNLRDDVLRYACWIIRAS